MKDAQLFSLRVELAFLDTRLGELASRLPDQHTKETWASVRRRISESLSALDEGIDPEDVRVHLEAGLEDLDIIRSDTDTWRAILEVMAERRRTAVEEQRRELKLEGTLTAAQFDLITDALGNAINEEVGGFEPLTPAQGEELLARIGARFAQTLDYPILEADTET